MVYGANSPHVGTLSLRNNTMNNEMKGAIMQGQRKRINIVPLFTALLLPWALFALVSYSITFKSGYGWCAMFAGLVVVKTFAYFSFQNWRVPRGLAPEREPSWMCFMFLSTLFAWVLAVATGYTNYENNMKPYYDMVNLNTYTDVYPDRMRGQQVMDAGIIMFADGSKLEPQKSMGFKNQNMYCVAPITMGGNTTMGTYDFWAVGKDCCSGSTADFHCTGFNDPNSQGGIRLMADADRAFYRLAVQQAEATYHIKAVHPLFFEWVQDAPAAVEDWREDGVRFYLMWLFGSFLTHAFLVAVAAIAFSKL